MRQRGKVTLRMPTSLHEGLVETARQETVSLNQFICMTLAAAIGWRAQDVPSEENESSPWKLWDDVFR